MTGMLCASECFLSDAVTVRDGLLVRKKYESIYRCDILLLPLVYLSCEIPASTKEWQPEMGISAWSIDKLSSERGSVHG